MAERCAFLSAAAASQVDSFRPSSTDAGTAACPAFAVCSCSGRRVGRPSVLNRGQQIRVRRVPSESAVVVRAEAGASTVSTTVPTEWFQKTVDLPSFRRGCHIVTQHINRAIPEIGQFHVGIVHLFVMHTSASLTINENASPDVPLDMEDSLNRIVPEGHHYRHLDEGLDDMPAHVKASMMGSSLTIPISSGRLHLGIWQGIWLNEHRNYGGSRKICVTIQGQKRSDGRAYR